MNSVQAANVSFKGKKGSPTAVSMEILRGIHHVSAPVCFQLWGQKCIYVAPSFAAEQR